LKDHARLSNEKTAGTALFGQRDHTKKGVGPSMSKKGRAASCRVYLFALYIVLTGYCEAAQM